ncbi:hepatic lectin-like [Styela clava]
MFKLLLVIACQFILVNSNGNVLKRAGEGWAAAANQYKYIVGTHGMPWAFAKTLCESKGAKLASKGIRDPMVRDYLYKYFIPNGAMRVWIGLTDSQQEGQWRWLDSVESTNANTPWKFSYPKNLTPDRDRLCQYGKAWR